MSPASYGVLKSQVDLLDELIRRLLLVREEAQGLLEPELKLAVIHSLDVVYRLVYHGKVKLLQQMEHPCAVG